MHDDAALQQQRQRAKRTAVVLTVLAFGVYALFFLKHFG